MKRMLMTACLTLQALLVGTAIAVEPIGQVVSLTGAAMVTGADGQAQRLALKSEVYISDHIETKADTKLQIVLVDEAVISVGANSSMKIDEYVYSVADQKDNRTTLAFLRGEFRVIAAKVADINPERFKVKSNMATVGIRGCELCFTIGADKESVQIVRLPEAKVIHFESLQGHGAMDVRQQGVTVDVDASGFTKRATKEAELASIMDSTTPVPTDDGVANVVANSAPPLEETPFLPNAAEVDAGIDVADSGVVVDSNEKVNREGDVDFVQNIVDDAVTRVSDVSLIAAANSGLLRVGGKKGDTGESITLSSEEPVPPAQVVPLFPQLGTPIQIASESGAGWSWGVWEQTDILHEGGDTRVSLTMQVNPQTVTLEAMNNLMSAPPVELNGIIMAAAGLTQGSQSALLLSDGGLNKFSLLAGSSLPSPIWDGAFSLSNVAGDQLVFSANGNVEANGSFSARVSTYSLQAFGNSYTGDRLMANSVGGTLVGGATVTGAAGQFAFQYGSGPRVKGVFGVDLK